MMGQFLLSAFFTIFSFTLFAQNLIQNPGFEAFEDCPKEYTTIGQKFKLPGWFSPSKGTPDYFNSCSRGNVGVPVNIMGHQWAKEGVAYIGLVLSEDPGFQGKKINEREYVSTQLTSTLVKDSLYALRFYYAVAPNSTYSINRIGICFTEKKPKCKKILKCTPIVALDSAIKDTLTGGWQLVSDTIKANGNENFLSIGNFYSDEQLNYFELDLSDHRKSLQEIIEINKLAYYYIDLIELMPVCAE
jgi:hypothetical protein